MNFFYLQDENKAVENNENDSGNQMVSDGGNEDKDIEDDSNDESVNVSRTKNHFLNYILYTYLNKYLQECEILRYILICTQQL